MSVKLKFREVNTTEEFDIIATLGFANATTIVQNPIKLYENPIAITTFPKKYEWSELNTPINVTFELVANPSVKIVGSYSRAFTESPYEIVNFSGHFTFNNNHMFIYIGQLWNYRKISQPSYSSPYLIISPSNKSIFDIYAPKTQRYAASYNNETYNYVTANNVFTELVQETADNYNYRPDKIYIGSQQIKNWDRDEVKVPIGSLTTYPFAINYNNNSDFYDAIFNYIPIPGYPNQNPDGDDDDSGQSPSDTPIPGDGDTTSDPIPNPPAKPAFDVTNTGFVVIYNPNVQEIRQLAYFMWSGEFVDLIKKMFASPFETIISLKMLFCPVTAGNTQTVWLGNVETDVTMAKVTDQFTDVDLGTINVNEFFGSFADYAPFTKIQIYLPFIGFKDLNVDEVMNSQLHLRYRVDVYTGACIAYLTVTKSIKSTNLNSILYQFDGNCAMEIPFTSNDNSRYVAAIMNSVASSALSLANTSGYTMPVAGKGFNQKAIPSTFELGSLAPVANGMLDIMSAKPNVQRAGSLSGAVSAMALKQPYIIIHRPIAQMPADYQKYLGIPLNLTRQLTNVTGYTIVSQVFMSSELATDREIAMITEALKNGVIL